MPIMKVQEFSRLSTAFEMARREGLSITSLLGFLRALFSALSYVVVFKTKTKGTEIIIDFPFRKM